MACEFIVIIMASTVKCIIELCSSYLQNISWNAQVGSYSNTGKFKINGPYLVSTKMLRTEHCGAQTERADLEDKLLTDA